MNDKKCIDMGSAYCPCALGLSGKCIVCRKMNGGSCADCSWQGVCIKIIAEQNSLVSEKFRREQKLKILEQKNYTNTLKTFVLEAPLGFCQKASKAGAYIFVRRPGAEKLFDLPVSVLKSEPLQGRIHIAINGCGPKSLDVFKSSDELCVRGVYFNGLAGLAELTEFAEPAGCSLSESCEMPGAVVYAKGIAIAPLNNLAECLKPIAHLYVDMTKINEDFFYEYFGWIDASKCVITDFRTNQNIFEETYDLTSDSRVAALVSPYYVKLIKKQFIGHLITPAAGNFCCGEGVCGACSFDDAEGNSVHRCKAVM